MANAHKFQARARERPTWTNRGQYTHGDPLGTLRTYCCGPATRTHALIFIQRRASRPAGADPGQTRQCTKSCTHTHLINGLLFDAQRRTWIWHFGAYHGRSDGDGHVCVDVVAVYQMQSACNIVASVRCTTLTTSYVSVWALPLWFGGDECTGSGCSLNRFEVDYTLFYSILSVNESR